MRRFTPRVPLPLTILAAAFLTAHATADNFLWQPTCDNVWQTCCDLGQDHKQNNWGRISPAPVCPALPGGTDNVLIASDCIVAPTPTVAAGILEQSGGTFTLNGPLQIGTSAEFYGPFFWNEGEIARFGSAGPQYARMHGGLTIQGDAPRTLSFFGGFRLINAGVGTWSGNGAWTIGMIPGGCCPAIFENAVGATFTVLNDAPILQTSFGPGQIINAGTLIKDQSAGVSTWNASVFNTGTVHVKTGVLRLTRAGAIAGAWNVDPGAELQIAGNFFTLDPAVTLAGRVVVLDSGTNPGIRVDEPVTIDDLTVAATGILGGEGLLSIRGRLDVEGGIPASPIRILPGAELVSAGSQ